MVLQPSRRWCCFSAPGSLHQIGKPPGSLVVTPLLTRLADQFLMNTHGREVNIVPRRTDYPHPPLIFSPSCFSASLAPREVGTAPPNSRPRRFLTSWRFVFWTRFSLRGKLDTGKRLFSVNPERKSCYSIIFFYQIGSLFLVICFGRSGGEKSIFV